MNFKEMLNKLFNYLLAGIAILGFTILYVGLKGNTTFLYIGIIILLPFLTYFLIIILKEKKSDNTKKLEIQKLKKYGEKIIVNLENIKINSNSWTQEVRETSKYEDKVSYVNINYNLIDLKIPYKDEFIYYNLHINMDTTTLKMHFIIKKETILYVDLNNKDKNYLDLEFLEN